MDKDGKDMITFDAFLYKVRNLGWLLDPVEVAKYKSQLVQRSKGKRGNVVRNWSLDYYSLSIGLAIGAISCYAFISMAREK